MPALARVDREASKLAPTLEGILPKFARLIKLPEEDIEKFCRDFEEDLDKLTASMAKEWRPQRRLRKMPSLGDKHRKRLQIVIELSDKLYKELCALGVKRSGPFIESLEAASQEPLEHHLRIIQNINWAASIQSGKKTASESFVISQQKNEKRTREAKRHWLKKFVELLREHAQRSGKKLISDDRGKSGLFIKALELFRGILPDEFIIEEKRKAYKISRKSRRPK